MFITTKYVVTAFGLIGSSAPKSRGSSRAVNNAQNELEIFCFTTAAAQKVATNYTSNVQQHISNIFLYALTTFCERAKEQQQQKTLDERT